MHFTLYWGAGATGKEEGRGVAIRAAPLGGLGTRDERDEAQPLWSVRWQVVEKTLSLVLETTVTQ